MCSQDHSRMAYTSFCYHFCFEPWTPIYTFTLFSILPFHIHRYPCIQVSYEWRYWVLEWNCWVGTFYLGRSCQIAQDSKSTLWIYLSVHATCLYRASCWVLGQSSEPDKNSPVGRLLLAEEMSHLK